MVKSSPKYRKILHIDLDAFFCAVEELNDPTLIGKPFAVGGSPQSRGVVSSCSYAARKFGVRSAMPMAQAVRKCPNLIVISARHRNYGQISKQVMDRLRHFTDLVQVVSIDEAFLDVSEDSRTGEEIARQIQTTINRDLKLPCSIGVASNKLVAKIATNVGKAISEKDEPPNAILVVPHGEESQFLKPLPTDALWGVGPKTAMRLAEMGINTVGDIQQWSDEDIIRRFGKHGQDLVRKALGIDDSPVKTLRDEAKSVSNERTYAQDVRDRDEILRTLRNLSALVAKRLGRSNQKGRTIKIKIRWSDFTTITRQVTLHKNTNDEDVIFDCTRRLFEKEWKNKRPVRLLGIGVSGFTREPEQLSFWDVDVARKQKLEEVVREIRSRFGEEILFRGRNLKEG